MADGSSLDVQSWDPPPMSEYLFIATIVAAALIQVAAIAAAVLWY